MEKTLKFLNKEVYITNIKTIEQFIDFLLNEANSSYYQPFQWAIGEDDLEIKDIVRTIFEDFEFFPSFVYKYGETDESSLAIETVVYQLPSSVRNHYFEDGVFVYLDTHIKIELSKQQVKYYRFDFFTDLEDSPEILLFDISECDYELLSLLLPGAVFVSWREKVYAVFSGYLN